MSFIPLTEPLLVVSPHLDDAVLSCGDLLAAHPGSLVVTVFAGEPSASLPLTDWDRACGFSCTADVIPRRREEDQAALLKLRAAPLWLDFCDDQYHTTHDANTVFAALLNVIRQYRPGAVMSPVGLFHSDHRVAADAMLDVARRSDAAHFYLYEDVPYRRLRGELQTRLSQLQARGASLTPASFDIGLSTDKCAAIECYASQLRALATPGRPGHADAYLPERYWQLHDVDRSD